MSWQTLQEPTIYSDLHSRDIDIAIKHPRAPDHLNQCQYNIGHRARARVLSCFVCWQRQVYYGGNGSAARRDSRVTDDAYDYMHRERDRFS